MGGVEGQLRKRERHFKMMTYHWGSCKSHLEDVWPVNEAHEREESTV